MFLDGVCFSSVMFLGVDVVVGWCCYCWVLLVLLVVVLTLGLEGRRLALACSVE